MWLPMFPLGTVLFPHGYLPLHVFEPRYRQMTTDCLAADGCFGVVLIERGSEVGGGDVRTSVGTVARIVEAAELPDGRWYLAAVGTTRLRIDEWLPDDPYPQAEVTVLDERAPGDGARGLLDDATRVLRQVLALRAELGEAAPPATVDLDTDPVVASYQACVLAGLGPMDAYALLAEDDAEARLTRLTTRLDEEVEVLRFRLGA